MPDVRGWSNVFLYSLLPVLRRAVREELEDNKYHHSFGLASIITPGSPGAWDATFVEGGHAFLFANTYYVYYHGYASGGTFRIGVATAPTPYGLFTKSVSNPIVNLGGPGEWDAGAVACPKVIRHGDTYYLFYNGSEVNMSHWNIGYATASSPGGPFIKSSDNPLLTLEIPPGGYLCGITRFRNKWRMYVTYPMVNGFGPISLFTSDDLTGPYIKDREALPKGEPGTWNARGYVETGVLNEGNLIKFFLPASDLPSDVVGAGPHMGIGYAESSDGQTFYFSKHQPLIRPEEMGVKYLGEVAVLSHPPLYHVYSTYGVTSYLWEHISYNALSTGKPFKTLVPLLSLSSLAKSTESPLSSCLALYTGSLNFLNLTIEATQNGSATANPNITVYTYGSRNGVDFDTEAITSFNLVLSAGNTVRKTNVQAPYSKWLKFTVKNLDASQALTNITLQAFLGEI